MRRPSRLVCIATDTVSRKWCGTVHSRILDAGRSTLDESYRRATTQEPIIDGGSLVSPGLASQRDRFLTAKQGRLLHQRQPLLLDAQMPWGGHQLGRPADYLPPGTVGQWLPAPCNGGATRKPTKRPRGLTHNSRAGIPKRQRPNCHQRSTLKQAWTASVRKGEGRGPETLERVVQLTEGIVAYSFCKPRSYFHWVPRTQFTDSVLDLPVMLRRSGTYSVTVHKSDEIPQMQFLDKLLSSVIV